MPHPQPDNLKSILVTYIKDRRRERIPQKLPPISTHAHGYTWYAYHTYTPNIHALIGNACPVHACTQTQSLYACTTHMQTNMYT